MMNLNEVLYKHMCASAMLHMLIWIVVFVGMVIGVYVAPLMFIKAMFAIMALFGFVMSFIQSQIVGVVFKMYDNFVERQS